MKKSLLPPMLVVFLTVVVGFVSADVFDIVSTENKADIVAGILSKELILEGNKFCIRSYRIDESELLAPESYELSFRLSKATPNEEPQGVRRDESVSLPFNTALKGSAEVKTVLDELNKKQNIQWTDATTFRSDCWDDVFQASHFIISRPNPETVRLNVRFASFDADRFPEMVVNVFYEVYQGHPSIRKWIEITNNGPYWLRLDQFILDGSILSGDFDVKTDLTPVEYGAVSSIRSYGNAEQTRGIVVGSEIPSALRMIHSNGSTGYTDDYFEWILGPAETFVSEPVFHYAYSGESRKTISAVSTAHDRTVEKPFKEFLFDHVGLKRIDVSRFVPLWCSWSNFRTNFSHDNLVEMAIIAEKCGFRGMLIDDTGRGLSETDHPMSTLPDGKLFPDFKLSSEAVLSRNMSLGLWVSCFRRPDFDPDFKVIPDAASLPNVKRDRWITMSFASQWRRYYANTLLRHRDRYGISYFKQDFSNIKFGDIALGHESRTLKESYLRGLRGLLEAQNILTSGSPDVNVEITHEIYWGTPGVPCDLAALKHVHTYHVPPNDYYGAGHRGERVNESWKENSNFAPEKLRKQLLIGCARARNRFYSYRALPLQCIEYYGAATVNFQGSLTPDIQKRQVCSWLLGIPSVYAGDMASLTEENIQTYKKCFELLGRLNQEYDIYRNFQYSGVPAPTDEDWHWWGKINEKGEGAVVVLRGNGGDDSRKINIPWVLPERSYTVRSCFMERHLGVFSGDDLMNGRLELALPLAGQEILELRIRPE